MEVTGKAVISNRIYFKYKDSKHLAQLKDSLTYTIETRSHGGKKGGSYNKLEIIKTYKLFAGGIISIPQGRLDLVPEDYEILDKRIKYEVPFPKQLLDLRGSQQPIYDAVDDSCFINALVGWGKTFTALAIAKKLGQKTLVVTHNTALRDQWIEEVEKLFGHRPGIIGGGKIDIEDHFIVVGNTQTIIKFLPQISKEFGTLILDEAHHTPADTFTNIIDSSHARYRIGLSGTMVRTDGKHILFKDFFGGIVHKPPAAHTMNPVIRKLPTGIYLPPGKTYVQKLNDLLYDEGYQELIAALAIRQIEKGYKVLITASRTEFLKRIQRLIGEETCILITGELNGPEGFIERKRLIKQVEDGEKSCIAAARQIFTEGMSVNVLSCVILAEPTGNLSILEQLIGRIQRLHPSKENISPLVYDVQFSSPTERKQAADRQAFYVSKGWEILT